MGWWLICHKIIKILKVKAVMMLQIKSMYGVTVQYVPDKKPKLIKKVEKLDKKEGVKDENIRRFDCYA